MKLLLINPKFPESFWSFSWALKNVARDRETINSPLGLATLAGLTPEDWEIEIVDENVESIDWSAQADIVGVCGMGVQVERQREILNHFKKQGVFVVAGGSFASLCPEEYEGYADSVISGESEYIWPQFCKDFAAGNPQALYKETGNVNIQDSPCPRFDLLKLDRYQRVSLQFSRGCPFQCEFCDIIVMFGRTPRNKSMAQVEKELDCLREQGVTQAFFVDDNFIGNKKLAKDLLRFLAEYQDKHNYRFNFGTEASINLADNDELLQLFRRANFEWVFMGIETPNEESLKETKKFQNIKGSLVEKIQKIYASGLDIMGGFIVGFDADDETIFDKQARFIEESGIIVSMVALLTALPKTPLYDRLKKAGRLKDSNKEDNTRGLTNIVPLRMSEDTLLKGYFDLHHRILSDRSIYLRLKNKTRYLTHPNQSTDLTFKTQLKYFVRLLFKGVLLGGPKRMYYFTRSMLLGLKNPRVLSLVSSDWVAAISLQNYANRYFSKPASLGAWAEQHFQRSLVQKVYDQMHKRVLFKISQWRESEKISIDLKDSMDRRVGKTLVSSLRKYLRRCHGLIVLDFREVGEPGMEPLHKLLTRLEKYGHQIHLYLTEGTYLRFREELSSFQYTLVSVA